MFFKNKEDRIAPIKAEVDGLHKVVVANSQEVKTKLVELEHLSKENNNFQEEVYKALERIKIDMERRLVEFHKEVSDKYFQGLESVFKYTREIQLIDSLSKNTNGGDFKALRSALMQPLLDYRHKTDKEQLGAKIEKLVNNKFVAFIEERDKLHGEFIVAQREGRETKLLQGKLDMLNSIIKEAKNEEST